MSIHLIDLPKDPLMEIFSHLPPQVLAGRVSLVCKKFRELAIEPSLYQPYVKIIGKAQYEACADESFELNFDGLPPIDMKTAVAKVLPLFGRLDKEGLEIEDDAGLAILDIPANLSLNKLIALNPVMINQHWMFKNQTREILNAFGASVVPKAYRMMISRGILKGSDCMDRYMKSESVVMNDLAKKVECRLPKALEIYALALITILNSSSQSPVRLFEKSSLCLEHFDRGHQWYRFAEVRVGFISPYGLSITYLEKSGAAVVRKMS